jgi:hypothetical protein
VGCPTLPRFTLHFEALQQVLERFRFPLATVADLFALAVHFSSAFVGGSNKL